MKFYNDKFNTLFFNKIINNDLTCVYSYTGAVIFYKNGKQHNSKNASYYNFFREKSFMLKNKYYGDENSFTKLS